VNCTPDGLAVAWHISTHSQGGSGNCVEAGLIQDGSHRVAVRDSTRRTSGTLATGRTAWAAFTTVLQAGGLTHG